MSCITIPIQVLINHRLASCESCSCCRFVGAFISRKERLKDMGHNTRFTNLYVKNFSEDTTEDDLRDVFGKFGTIMSAVVMVNQNTGKSLCYGFVSFDDHASASEVSTVAVVRGVL